MEGALVTVNWITIRERLPSYVKNCCKKKLIAVQYYTRFENTAE